MFHRTLRLHGSTFCLYRSPAILRFTPHRFPVALPHVGYRVHGLPHTSTPACLRFYTCYLPPCAALLIRTRFTTFPVRLVTTLPFGRTGLPHVYLTVTDVHHGTYVRFLHYARICASVLDYRCSYVPTDYRSLRLRSVARCTRTLPVTFGSPFDLLTTRITLRLRCSFRTFTAFGRCSFCSMPVVTDVHVCLHRFLVYFTDLTYTFTLRCLLYRVGYAFDFLIRLDSCDLHHLGSVYAICSSFTTAHTTISPHFLRLRSVHVCSFVWLRILTVAFYYVRAVPPFVYTHVYGSGTYAPPHHHHIPVHVLRTATCLPTSPFRTATVDCYVLTHTGSARTRTACTHAARTPFTRTLHRLLPHATPTARIRSTHLHVCALHATTLPFAVPHAHRASLPVHCAAHRWLRIHSSLPRFPVDGPDVTPAYTFLHSSTSPAYLPTAAAHTRALPRTFRTALLLHTTHRFYACALPLPLTFPVLRFVTCLPPLPVAPRSAVGLGLPPAQRS